MGVTRWECYGVDGFGVGVMGWLHWFVGVILRLNIVGLMEYVVLLCRFILCTVRIDSFCSIYINHLC